MFSTSQLVSLICLFSHSLIYIRVEMRVLPGAPLQKRPFVSRAPLQKRPMLSWSLLIVACGAPSYASRKSIGLFNMSLFTYFDFDIHTCRLTCVSYLTITTTRAAAAVNPAPRRAKRATHVRRRRSREMSESQLSTHRSVT